MKPGATAVGHHILVDLCDVDAATLCDGETLERLLCGAAVAAGARVLSSHFHSFGAGGGITGVVLLAESHISIHTWPEHRLAAADIFMCGAADGERALAALVDGLAGHVNMVSRQARLVALKHLPVSILEMPGE